MVNFAAEMERQGLDIPLLIGGATTSRAHTAVKVDERYHGPVVWVKDASRSVPVVAALLSDDQRPALLAEVEKDFTALRERHAAKLSDRPLVSLEKARANRTPIDWTSYRPPHPRLLTRQEKDVWSGHPDEHWHAGAKQFVKVFRDYPLAELRDYIDWQPFFNAWEMKGRFPDILNNPASGETARKLYDDANRMLDQLIEGRWLHANGVVGLFPANTVGHDDIEVYTNESRTSVRTTLRTLRQQGAHRGGVPNRALADFVAPKETGLHDYVGGFAVTTGLGIGAKIDEFKAALDDYSAILLESLADRLAEAFAERMHERVRRDLWGYAPDEHLDSEALIAERYQGIRPAPGYPACPDHTEKATLWELLDVTANAGIELTESMAMWPGAAVSGWYFSHPQSQYFVVGRLGRDQVVEYAERKGWSLREAERWLSPNLGYQPED
jgi:5-methyltetrahydrofolate--homocysteine methyltransferase